MQFYEVKAILHDENNFTFSDNFSIRALEIGQ